MCVTEKKNNKHILLEKMIFTFLLLQMWLIVKILKWCSNKEIKKYKNILMTNVLYVVIIAIRFVTMEN